MFVVEVEIVKEWTDRGGTKWRTVRIMGDRSREKTERNVPPERVIQLKRSLISIDPYEAVPLSGSGGASA